MRLQQLGGDAGALVGVGFTQGGSVKRVAVDQTVKFFQAQQVAHQTAARMRDQVNDCAFGQSARQLQGVVDRAFRQTPVFQRQHAVAVALLEAAPVGGGHALQIVKAALRAGACAVDEHQQRPGFGIGLQLRVAAFKTVRQLTAAPAVQTGVAFQAAFNCPHQRFGAGPAHAQVGVLRYFFFGSAGEIHTQEFTGLAPGGLNQRVVVGTHRHLKNARYPVTHATA